MNIKFVNECLINVLWHENNSYQVEGLLKESNQYYKFDIRNLNDFIKYCNVKKNHNFRWVWLYRYKTD